MSLKELHYLLRYKTWQLRGLRVGTMKFNSLRRQVNYLYKKLRETERAIRNSSVGDYSI